MAAPQFSVVIPLHNKRTFVERCLSSVFAQTFTDYEIIIVDDGSNDGSGELVDAKFGNRVQLLRQPNLGPGAARNRGARQAAGPNLAFLDADDSWEPEFLHRAHSALSSDDKAAAFAAGHFRTRAGQKVSTQPMWRGVVPSGSCRLPSGITADHFWHYVIFFTCSSVAIRAPVFHSFGGFFEGQNCSYGEDGFLWIQILLNHRVHLDVSPLAWYDTDASTLGVGRRSPYPTEPMILWPDSLRSRCPLSHAGALERLLLGYAEREIWRKLEVGDFATAASVARRFPRAGTRVFLKIASRRARRRGASS